MHNISWWRTSLGEDEISGITSAINNECISQGPLTLEFEKKITELLNVPYAVATTSGSVALLMALMALGIGRDDEVIVPNRTWVATAHAGLLLGAKIVLVDVLPDIPIMDVSQIRAKITSRTKAIIPVHLNGRSVNMAELNQLGREFNIPIVEDACQALFSRNSSGFLGTQSDIGCFSLGVTKLLTTGQGGLLVTKQKHLYEKLLSVRNHGVVDNFTDTWNGLGCNFKFTDILAALGLAQLSKATQRINHTQKIYTLYKERLAANDCVKLIPVDSDNGELSLFIEVLCNKRGDLVNYLQSKGIQTRPSLPSLHTSNYIGNHGVFPNSELFATSSLFLPCGPSQPLENVVAVLDAINNFSRL